MLRLRHLVLELRLVIGIAASLLVLGREKQLFSLVLVSLLSLETIHVEYSH